MSFHEQSMNGRQRETSWLDLNGLQRVGKHFLDLVFFDRVERWVIQKSSVVQRIVLSLAFALPPPSHPAVLLGTLPGRSRRGPCACTANTKLRQL